MSVKGPIDIKKYKDHIINLGVILVFVFVAVNIYRGQMAKIADARVRNEMEKKKNAALGEISQLEKKSDLMRKTVNNKDVSGMMDIFGQLAREAEVSLISFRPEKEETFPLYARYPAELIIESVGYHNLGMFISKVENHPHLYKVESMELRPVLDDRSGRLVKIIATLKISTVLALK